MKPYKLASRYRRPARGHGWGYLRCPADGQRLSVWSTPKNADNHAKQIRRFITRHSHLEEQEEPDDQL
jgi:hypothetical protein